MKILVSNDDGIHARGIRVLARRLAEDPGNEVYVVAPDRERSATGHSLTLNEPLRVGHVPMGENIAGAWATTGTPSDCVKFAVCALLDGMPDLLVSGINAGPNLGGDVLYSGTVSAAMEGALLSIPSIAMSMGERSPKYYEVAAEFASQLSKLMSTFHLPRRTLLNVNVPNLPSDEIAGVAITELGVRLYNDTFEKRLDPRGKAYYWLTGHVVEEGEVEGSDVCALRKKQISITPVTFNMTDRHSLTRLGQWQELDTLSGSWQHLASSNVRAESSQ